LFNRQSLKPRPPLTEAETQDFINELEINKLELELQNDELRHAWAMAEVASNRYNELYDFAPIGYTTLTHEGKIVELNLPCSRLLGKERSRIKNARFSQFLAPVSQPVFALFLEKVFSGKSMATCEVSLTTNENSSARIQLSGVITEQGENCFMTLIDITDRAKAEENLMVSNELLSLFMKHSPIYSFIKEVTSTESRVLKASDNYLDMIGIAGSEMIGKTMYDLFPAEFAAKITADDWLVVSENKTVTEEENLNGRHYTTIKFPIFQGGKHLLAGYTIDVTDLKKAEAALQKSELAIRNKLRSILDPECDMSTLELADAIDSPALQSMMEEFYRLTHIGIGILDLKGVVLVGVGWQDICTRFHRLHPDTLANCIESDVVLSANVPEGSYKAYRCKNNLWDIMTPIMVGGRHLGNVCLGQFFFEDEIPDFELFRRQAQQFGFDETEYLAAVSRVPRFSREVVDATMTFYAKLASMIASLSYSTVKLSHTLNQKEIVLERLADSERLLNESRETQERHVEERTCELVKSNALLEETGSLAKAGGWEVDLVTGKNHWSDITRLIHEVEPGFEPTLETAIQFYAPESLPVISACVERLIKYGEPFNEELELITAKQNRKWVRAIARAYRDNGNIVRIGGIFQDITEKKKTELELTKYKDHLEELILERNKELSDQYSRLQLSELHFRKIFKDGSIAMALVDSTFHFTMINTAFTALLGYTSEEAAKLTFPDITAPEYQTRDIENVHQLLQGKIPVYRTEKCYITKNNERVWGLVQVVALTNNDGTFIAFLVMIDDITDRKRIEIELISLNASLEERIQARTTELETTNKELAFRLKEIEQFTYIATHDLQEPLLGLTNFATLIQDEYTEKLDEDGRKSLDYLAKSAMRMRKLVKGLMEYSLLGKDRVITLIDMNKLTEDMLSDMDALIKASNAIITVHGLPEVSGCLSELRLLLDHLVGNAIKFRRQDVRPEIKISAEIRKNEVIFSVEDNGIGIMEKDREKIFTIFRQLHDRNKYEGIGIGLACCKKIVELHGGKIWSEPKQDVGSIFNFTIPKS
jgi:PAS domain S-box-containing protein